jgi:probable rRNA maturation factor
MDLLDHLGLEGRDLSILFVDDRRISRYNDEFFGKDKPTNVISFSYVDGLPSEVLGDIVISLETARREAESAGISFYDRVFALIIHGLLHILGFDHEIGDKERRRMRYREKRLFAFVATHHLYQKLVQGHR